jgi:hypothetical protein
MSFNPADSPDADPETPVNSVQYFRRWAAIACQAQCHIDRGEFLEAAKLYHQTIQLMKTLSVTLTSKATAEAPNDDPVYLRVISRPRVLEPPSSGWQKPAVPFNCLELYDSFFVLQLVEFREDQGDSDNLISHCDHLINLDEECMGTLVSLSLYNLAMTLLWSAVAISPNVSVSPAVSPETTRAQQILELIEALPPQKCTLKFSSPGCATCFSRLKANVALAVANNLSYIHSLRLNYPAVQASLVRMKTLMAKSSVAGVHCTIRHGVQHFPPLKEVAMLNVYLLCYSSVSGAPVA